MSEARTLEDDDRCGRIAMTMTPEDVPRVESLIKKDAKMAYAVMHDIMKILSGSLTHILHDSLDVRKRCTRWVPHNLSEEQKLGRVDWCTHMLRKFDGGRSPRVWDIVTGDKIWVYQGIVGGMGLPTCEIQKKQKCYQKKDGVFLCKIWPCCYHTAGGQKNGC